MFFVYLLEGTEPLVTRCTSRWLGVHFTLSPWCNQLLSWTLNLFALYCSLVTVAKAPDQIWKMFWRASAMNWFLLLECFVPKHFFIYICIYIYIYTRILFSCVYIYTQAELLQQFPALTTPVEVCGWMKSFLSWWEPLKQLWWESETCALGHGELMVWGSQWYSADLLHSWKASCRGFKYSEHRFTSVQWGKGTVSL